MDEIIDAYEFSGNYDDAMESNRILKEDGTLDKIQDQVFNNKRIMQRESYIPVMHRPGAHYVPGDEHFLAGGVPIMTSATGDETSLQQTRVDVTAANEDEVSLGIIEGISIRTSSAFQKWRKSFLFLTNFLVVFLSCSLLGIVYFVFIEMYASEIIERELPTASPSLLTIPPSSSPSLSAAPTVALNHHIKELIFPLSNKNSFEDETSPQVFSLQKVTHEFNNPDFLKETNTSLDDENIDFHITQRYLVTVVMASAGSLSKFKPPVNAPRYVSICALFTCNENNEILVIAFPKSSIAGGTIATEIGLLPTLTHLLFAESLLYGTIPTEISNLINLNTLDLNRNNIVGPIPTQFGLMQNLQWLFVQKNNITGTIPLSFGNMTSLIFADVSENKLTGSISTQFRMLKNLKGLALQGNNFFGDINGLCSNSQHEKYHEEVSLGDSIIFNLDYSYQVDFGISISCKDSNIACSCCLCA